MKYAHQLNPLCNPVAPGEQVKAGGRYYWADTDMGGQWRVYEILTNIQSISTLDRGHLVAEGLDGQAALCAWFYEQEEKA